MRKIRNVGVIVLITICGVFITVASTNSPAVASVKCICPDVYKPVCIIATGQQFSNACQASCAGYSPKDWFDCSVL